MAMISATAVVLAARPSPTAGLPQLRVARVMRLRCSSSKDTTRTMSTCDHHYCEMASSALAPVILKGAPLLTAASAMSSAALAEVDERMSAERTWLSNDLLGWIVLVAVGLVLSFYTVYSSMSILDGDNVQSGASGIML
ncbi:hypothetical protein VPH35_010238 [Triticum aestivum]